MIERQRIFVVAIAILIIFQIASCVRQPCAQVTVEFGAPNDKNAESAIRNLLPKGDATFELRTVRNTGLFEIRVYGANGVEASNRANKLTVEIQEKLNAPSGGKAFRIWERAEPFPQ